MSEPTPEPIAREVKRPALALFQFGFVTLFLELALIRYLAGNVWNLGFFPNLVLMGTFVGMGTGFVAHHFLSQRASLLVFALSPMALLLLVAVVDWWHPVVPGFDAWTGEVGGELYFTNAPRSSGGGDVALLFVWFFGVIAVFAMISQLAAKIFARLDPLRAYTFDILGSCCGIATFTLLSWAEVPAGLWFLVLIPFFQVTRSWLRGGLAVAALLAATLLAFHQDAHLVAEPGYRGAFESFWSPYQKVEYRAEPGGERIYVNGIGHQRLHTPERIARMFYQVVHDDRAARGLSPFARVMVIGAGSGNDVTSALRNGAEHVDALEIDPVIARIGREHHAGRPYSDERVRLVVGDARSFLNETRDRYDLIVFALTDSLVKVSPMAQLRLENFVFTTQAIARAFSRLDSDGELVFYNFYRKPWLLEKLRRGIREATGHEPRVLYQRADFVMLAVEKSASSTRVAAAPPPAAAAVEVATDDWPFPYLKNRGLPGFYVAALGVLLLYVLGLFALVQWSARGRAIATAAPLSTRLAFLCMGAAFLLLETKSIIQFSLLFGATWLNNSLVFMAVLLLVLAANWVASVLRARWLLWLVFPLLLLGALAQLVFPLSGLLGVEDPMLRFVAASLLTFSPVFFANLLFSIALRSQHVAEHVFGWNLLGSTLGGVFEYSSMALGYDALTVVVALTYSAAFLLLLRGGLAPPHDHSAASSA